jgi:hypothetical protein
VQSSPNCQAGSFGYAAGSGYDLATGLGSIDANNLITRWNTRSATTSTTLAADSTRVNWGATVHLTAMVSAASGMPGGSVSFNVGDTSLGVAQLTASGNSMIATISVATSQLPYGANTVTAIYGGDRSFNGSSASITIDAGLPIGESAVVPSITPAPLFESPLTANLWSYAVKLTEAAGVATVITDYTIDGISHIEQLYNRFRRSNTAGAWIALGELDSDESERAGYSGLRIQRRRCQRTAVVAAASRSFLPVPAGDCRVIRHASYHCAARPKRRPILPVVATIERARAERLCLTDHQAGGWE